MKNNKHIRKYITALLLTFFVGVGSVFAQVTKSKGTRITDDLSVSTSDLKSTAILDLDSTTKGFFLPRMTTAQRDELKKKMDTKDNGLAVYNIDIDCVEYWSERTQKWMSLCGNLPPAVLDIADGSCATAKFVGINHATSNTWQQGTPFKSDGSQYMEIEVKVESVGTYQISASTDNGYFFAAEGQFQSTGTYPIIMKAMGTPINGYDQSGAKKGDKLKFNFNGKVSAGCPNLELAIVPADLKFTIESVGPAIGTYNVFEQADKAKNTIEVSVKSTTTGTASITAYNTALGVKFTGSKKVLGNSSVEKIILEPVLGECAPNDNAAGTYDLTIQTNVATANQGGLKSTITILPTKIVGHGVDATFGTVPYFQGTAITPANTIEVPIEVLSSGKSKLFLKGGGVEFESGVIELRMPKATGEKQKVTFTAKPGTLPDQASLTLTLSGDGAKFSVDPTSKDVTLPIAKKPVAYTVDCSKITGSRSTVLLNKPILETYTIIVPVNVITPGEYELNTVAAVDGIYFSSTRKGGQKASFATPGPAEAILYATDPDAIPGTVKTFATSLINNDGNTQTVCNSAFNVKVGNVDLNAIVVNLRQEDGWGSSDPSGLPGFLTGNKRFGEGGRFVDTGTVNVKNIIIYRTESAEGKASNAKNLATLQTELATGKYNLVIFDDYLTFNEKMTPAIKTELKNYLDAKKGWLVVFDSGEKGYTSSVNTPYSGSATWIQNNLGSFTAKNYSFTTGVLTGVLVPTNSHFTFSNQYAMDSSRSITWFTSGVQFVNYANYEPLFINNATGKMPAGLISKTHKFVYLPVLQEVAARVGFSDTDMLDPNNSDALRDKTYDGRKLQNNRFTANLIISLIQNLMK